MQQHPNVVLATEVLATLTLVFGPIALAIGEVASRGI